MARYMIRFLRATDGVLYDHVLKLRTPVHIEEGEEVSGTHTGDEKGDDGEEVSLINFGPTLTMRVPVGTFEYRAGRFLLNEAPSYKRRGAKPMRRKP